MCSNSPPIRGSRRNSVDLFAALDIATGEVLTQTRRRHTGADVLAFFKHIDRDTPGELDVHVISDDLSAHKSQPVREWLTHPRRERWHLHFTPTSSSWANLVEGWFSILTRKAIKNRAFTSVADLESVICDWTTHWNHNPQPLRWTKPAEEIIAKPNEPKKPSIKPGHTTSSSCSLRALRSLNVAILRFLRFGRDHSAAFM